MSGINAIAVGGAPNDANVASGAWSFVAGTGNEATGSRAFVGAGRLHQAHGASTGILAGNDNETDVSAQHSAIAGGERNLLTSSSSFVGGGTSNEVHASRGTVVAGQQNTISENGFRGFIGSGFQNQVDAPTSGVVSGQRNEAFGDISFVGGGGTNRAHAGHTAIAGGQFNWATGEYAHVPGGYRNRAMGDYAMAAGKAAGALHDGSFVWSDSRGGLLDEFASTAEDQFLIAAEGGVGINTNSPQALLDVAGDTRLGGDTEIAGRLLVDDSVGIGTAAPAHPLDVTGTIRGETLRSSGQTIVGGTMFLQTLGNVNGTQALCRVPSTGLVTTCSSSSLRYKHDIEPYQNGWGRLEALRPVSYRFTEGDQPDIGLIAEELAAIDERLVVFDDQGRPDSIRYSRLSVLLISAMQERGHWLDEQLATQAESQARLDNRLAELEAENTELRQIAEQNAALKERLARLESLLIGDASVAEATP